MSILFFVTKYAEMQRKQGVLSGSELGSETLANKEKNPYMLHTLTPGLKTQKSEYLFEKTCSTNLMCLYTPVYFQSHDSIISAG